MTRENTVTTFGCATSHKHHQLGGRRLHWPVIATLLMPLLLMANQSVKPSDEANRADPEVEAAFAAPPELGADLLIRIAESSHRPHNKRIDLLVSAFDLTSSAKYALRRVPATNAAYNTDSDAGVISAALRPGLDKMSLRSRVITALASLEPSLARRFFEISRHISVPNLSCEDALGYSFDDFYKSAIAVIRYTYSAKEVADGEPFRLAEGLLQGIASPFQLNGALQLLLHDEWSTEDLRALTSAFASAIAYLSADDRSFTAGTNFSSLQSLIRLATRLKANDIDPYPIIRGFREYLVRHLKASRCADTLESTEISRIIDLFNDELVVKVSGLSPITVDDRKPMKVVDAKARVYEFWSTTESERLLNELRLLRFGNRDQQEARNSSNLTRSDGLAPFLTLAERSTGSWRESFDAFMNRFSSWESQTTEPLLAQFYQKCSILVNLIAIVPDSDRKESLMRDLLTYLAKSEIRLTDPPVWRLQLDRALNMVELSEIERISFSGFAKVSGDMYMRILASRPRER